MHFTSLKTDLIFLQLRILELKCPWNCFFQYVAIFFNFSPTSSHLFLLQVENCDSNSRLVVDEDDNGKIKLERVNGLAASASFYGKILNNNFQMSLQHLSEHNIICLYSFLLQIFSHFWFYIMWVSILFSYYHDCTNWAKWTLIYVITGPVPDWLIF